MAQTSVVVIGAGAAGLSAARVLANAGLQVTVLEARDWPGGRIHTVLSRFAGIPIELGAEFVHGSKSKTWEILHATGLATHEVPDRHWIASEAAGAHHFTRAGRKRHAPPKLKLTEDKEFWDELAEVMDKIRPAQRDNDFDSFVRRLSKVKRRTKKLARHYVEGFHAAPADSISIHSLAQSESAAEQAEGTRQFRLARGYSQLLEVLLHELEAMDVTIMYRTMVRKLRWEHGRVRIECQTPDGPAVFQASSVLLTVPLSILKQNGSSAIEFEPLLGPRKLEAIRALQMGTVIKITLHFHARFWPVENFGFIHAPDEWLATWWADERGPLLTAWAGGPRAERLSEKNTNELLNLAISTAGALFNVDPAHVRDLLEAHYVHDWTQDPFSRGAYSYIPVGKTEMPCRLAEPVDGTLFFAGEATDTNGNHGTVHGALQSGKRAANEILSVCKPVRSILRKAGVALSEAFVG